MEFSPYNLYRVSSSVITFSYVHSHFMIIYFGEELKGTDMLHVDNGMKPVLLLLTYVLRRWNVNVLSKDEEEEWEEENSVFLYSNFLFKEQFLFQKLFLVE